jgi:glycine/D-amino acid oxidase-like deaminating enzyme
VIGSVPEEDRQRVVVIGGGLAGAACAAAIARRGRPVLLLEAEGAVARHSSGRSAGLVRLAVEDPALAPLCREGGAALAARGVGFTRTGSVLIDPRGRLPAAELRAVEHRPVPPAELRRRFPWLAGAWLDGAVECPADGIVDGAALVSSLLDEAGRHGAEVRLGERAVAPVLREGRVVGVRSERGEHAASDLVVAAGAWGAVWGRLGGVPIALEPTRRTLVRTELLANAAATTSTGAEAWVWQLEEGWYFRRDGRELLWSAGEEIPDLPGEAEDDDAAPDRLRALVAERLPAAGELAVRGHRTGHRTHLADRRFLLGPDPRCAGWHWAVGLGGHGVTAALAIGERVARALPPVEEPIDPRLAFRPEALPAGPERLAVWPVFEAVA